MTSRSSSASLTMMESPIMTSSSRGKPPPTTLPPPRQLRRPQDRFSWSDTNGDDDVLVLTDAEPEYFYSVMFSPQAAAHQQKFRVLGTIGLMGLTFFVSCGGPIGSEPLISAGGPLVGLTSLAVYVCLCVAPFAYTIAELGAAFPDNGGFTVWIMAAFGPFWGFQVGYWSWMSCTLNNAMYPGLLLTIVSNAFDVQLNSGVLQYLIKVGIACVLTMPSLFSVRLVSLGSFAMLIVVMACATLFSVYAFVDGEHKWSELLETRPTDYVANSTSTGTGSGSGSTGSSGDAGPSGVDWVLLVNTLFWNFDGLYDSSVIAGEVFNPARTFPRVIAMTVALTVVTYVVPLVAAVTDNEYHWSLWEEDSYPVIAEAIGGSFLHTVMLLCSVLSIIGLFTSSIFFQAFQILGMAEVKLLPPAFRRRHDTLQTPQHAVLISLVATLLLLAIDYESILGMTNALSAGIQVAIVLAMLQLRRSLPYMPRPTKVPGNFKVLFALLLPATGLFLYILFTTLFDPGSALVLCVLLLPGVGCGIYQRRHLQHRAQERARQHQLELIQRAVPELLPPTSQDTNSTTLTSFPSRGATA